MNKHIALTLIAFTLLSCSQKGSKNKTTPKVTNITESVYATVHVKPKISYSPQSIRSGIIEEIYVQEGDTVEKGQVLFQISPTADVKNQITNAELNLQEAKSNYLGEDNLLKTIRLEIETLKDQLVLDSVNYQRQKRLWSQNIGKKADYDQSKLKYENTQNQLNILNQKLAQTSVNLKNNYKKALSRKETEKSSLGYFTIKSEMKAKVYTVNKETGDFISSQEKFAEIGSINKFKIEMDVDEVDITKIKVGDTVITTLDAYEEQVFVATITKIYPKKNNVTQTFKVEGLFNKLPPKLYNGLTGEANIIVSKRKNTLVIPAEYLLPNNKVLTTKGEKSIVIGMKNLNFVEVLSGIDSATTIIKPE